MRIAVAALLTLALAGCGVELLTTTAIQGELQAEQMKSMDRQLKGAADTTSQINIERAIATYKAENGSNPPSLDALVPNYLPQMPLRPDGMAYGYDPVSGTLTGQGVPAPASAAAAGGPTQPDLRKIREIKEAINKYGSATGWYPSTLQDLVPAYLPAVLKTTSGQDFVYNNQNGDVQHPAQAAAQPSYNNYGNGANAGGVGVGGAGPMGEAMTGIGIQNQLNNMSNAGSSAAGSRARTGAGTIQDNYNQRQQEALDQLGY